MSNDIKGSLELAMEHLKSIEERRERIIKGSRDALMLCSKSIVSIHANRMSDALEHLSKAKSIIEELKQVAEEDLQSYIIPVEAELVEAQALYSILTKYNIPSLDELNVNARSYILGLLDCIGELKRQVYDKVREGKSIEAFKLFEVMEYLYSSLLQFAMYDNILHGVRKKVDVARVLVEDVRAMLTEEARRQAIIESIDSIRRVKE
jgi:translin